MTELNDKQIEILQVAERLFAEDGFDGTSIRTIAREANVNIAMISYYFGSKEKLLEALIVNRTSGMKMQLENIFNDDSSPIVKLDRLIELYISRINKNQCMYRILHFELASKKRILDMQVFTDIKRQNLEIFTRFIEEGQAAGIFKKDVNIILIPGTIMGALVNFQMNRLFYEKVLDLKTEQDFENYVANDLTKHIKKTIKALLINEN